MKIPRPEDFGIDPSKATVDGQNALWFPGRWDSEKIEKFEQTVRQMESDVKFLKYDYRHSSSGVVTLIIFSIVLALPTSGLLLLAITATGHQVVEGEVAGALACISTLYVLFFLGIRKKEKLHFDSRVFAILTQYKLSDIASNQAQTKLAHRAELLRNKILPYLKALQNYHEAMDRRGVQWWTNRNGKQLEDALTDLFRSVGYEAIQTKGSNDGGIDVIVKTSKNTFLIQCKGWKSRVGVVVIRELAGVIAHADFQLPVGVVLATGGYTYEAVKFAASSGILLWGPKELTDIANGDKALLSVNYQANN
jgi:HJR/Mrr/RecB family endonuclease